MEFDNMFSYGKKNVIDFTKLNGVVGVVAQNHSGKSALIYQLLELEKGQENFHLTNINRPEEFQKVFQNPDTQIISSTLGGELAFSLECRSNDQEYISTKLASLKEKLFFEN